jgi:DNA primase
MRDGVLLVEGYFDVLMLRQGGIHNAVAPLGTALTEEQLKSVARFTKKVVLCFDGDEAGRRAAEKSLELALPMGFAVRLLALPQGEDPDTWCARKGADNFRKAVADAPDWVGFVMDRAREGRDIKRASDRMEIFGTFARLFSFMPRGPENWSLLQSVAAELGIPKHELNRALSGRAAGRGAPPPSHGSPGPRPRGPGAADLDVDDLLRPFFILCRDEAGIRKTMELPADWWERLAGARELQAVLDCEGDDSLLPEGLLGSLRRLEAAWAMREGVEVTFERAALALEKAYLLREIELGRQLLRSPGVVADHEAAGRLEAKLARLLKRKSALAKAAWGD